MIKETKMWLYGIAFAMSIASAVRAQSTTCDSDIDCASGQFCMGSSLHNRVATASSTDLISSPRNSTNLPLFVDAANIPTVTGPVTLFGKVRQDPGNNGWVVSKARDTMERDYGLYLRGSHDQMWFVFNPSDRSNRPGNELFKPIFKQGLGVDDGQWHTVAASFDPANNRVEFFVDGELRAVEVEELDPDYRGTTNILAVGGRAGGPEFTFRGTIEIARVYSVVLTEAEVLEAHQEAMLGLSRVCTSYQNAGQPCEICGTTQNNCTLRCGPNSTCVGYGLDPVASVAVPVGGTQYVNPTLTGRCTTSCPCSTAVDAQPVCAQNGVTYENQCFANCIGQQVLHNGTCVSFQTLYQQKFPGSI